MANCSSAISGEIQCLIETPKGYPFKSGLSGAGRASEAAWRASGAATRDSEAAGMASEAVGFPTAQHNLKQGLAGRRWFHGHFKHIKHIQHINHFQKIKHI